MSTALFADHEFGTMPRWPLPEIGVSDFFDRPPWERPTPERPYVQPGGAESFTGTPGFGGTGSSEPSTGTPGFDGLGSIGGSAWTNTPNGGIILINTTAGPVSINVEPNRRTFYTIEIRDTDSDLVARVPDWISGTLKLQMDRASELGFRIPANSAAASDLVRPNTIWLRDRWGFVIETFLIQKRKPNGTGDASYIDFECQSEIAQLGDEIVLRYDGASDPVSTHVGALMDLQEKNPLLTVGTIDPEIADIELPFFAEDTSIHAALLQLQMALPRDQRGHIYVDAQRRLQWRINVGDQTEQVITRQRNVYAVDAEVDYSHTVNRIYMYGEGQDTLSRLTLQDAGEAADYIEDAASVTANGLCPFLKVDRRIRNPETLLKAAQRILDEFATPPVTVTVELLDLAKSDSAPTGWEDIYIGGLYRVVDADLGLDSSIEIVGIELDLAHPVPLRVDLANQTRNLSDFISDIIDALQQPLDVDGDRYPTMGRNYTSQDPRAVRAGDTRWNTDRGQMHDGTDWQDMGGGDTIWYTATTLAGLPTSVAETALGRVTEGVDAGNIYARNADNDDWVQVYPTPNVCLIYTATSKAGLPSGVAETSLGRVTSGTNQGVMYKRNSTNTGWESFTKWES